MAKKDEPQEPVVEATPVEVLVEVPPVVLPAPHKDDTPPVVLRYVGDGRAIVNVPARDLTDADLKTLIAQRAAEREALEPLATQRAAERKTKVDDELKALLDATDTTPTRAGLVKSGLYQEA